MKRAGLKYKITVVFLMTLMLSLKVFSQVGGNSSPLQNSTHTYSILMGDDEDAPSWRILSGTLTAQDIDLGLGVVVVRNVGYIVEREEISGGYARITIEFSGTMAPGNYTMAYKETNDDNCFRTVAYNFTLHPPMDVDVVLANGADAARCPDLSGTPEPPGFRAYRTTVSYIVRLTHPAVYAGTNWQFRLIATVTGQSGASATVYQITADDGNDSTIDNTFTPAPGLSTFSQDYAVSNTYSQVLFTVTYNDVLGIDQNVRFEITAIEGSYLEIDVDASNRVDHTIYLMPAAGDLEAMN